jgi:L-gulono-1,4-lactone dehydrogenase
VTAGWTNWGRNQRAHPARIVTPRSVPDVVACVRAAARDDLPVKALGAGHSFSAVAVTDGLHVRPGGLTGLRSFDASTGEVTVESGMRLGQLNALLEHAGRALINLGDIDAQTVAGAIATGTHGSGRRSASLAEQVVGLELVLADGTVVQCSGRERSQLFHAARIGLGAFGIVTAVTLRTEPLFLLEADERPMPLDALLTDLDALAEGNDHVDVYWWPHTRQTLVKRNNRVAGPATPLPRVRSWLEDEVLANGALAAITATGQAAPRIVPALNRLTTRALPRRTYSDVAHRVLTSTRRVGFVETEWALPREAVVPALRELDALIERTGLLVNLPVQVRVAPGDDIWLSPAYGRATGYIAAHVPRRVPYTDYFGAVENLMTSYDGRPHWGKLHTRTASDFAVLYPCFAEVVAVRDEVDPDRRFANDHLRQVLGP